MVTNMWAYESVFYQIYPMGFCGVPFENDGIQRHEIKRVEEWIPHMQKLGVNAVYFSPVFESDTHGYNTRDYRKIDVRLGTNEDFKEVCDALHAAGIRVVLDGVFNHVGRGFAQFQDVIKNRENSPYVNWFYRIDFGGNSNYNDGLWYEGWEGCFDLVKLNLQNPEVVNYLLDSVKGWIDEFGIDGLRLDVAYSLDENFVRRLREVTAGVSLGCAEIFGSVVENLFKIRTADAGLNGDCGVDFVESDDFVEVLADVDHDVGRHHRLCAARDARSACVDVDLDAVCIGVFDKTFDLIGSAGIDNDVGHVFDNAFSKAHNVDHGFAVCKTHSFKIIGGCVFLADDCADCVDLFFCERALNMHVANIFTRVNHFLEVVVGQIELLFDQLVKTFFGCFVDCGVAPFHDSTERLFVGCLSDPFRFKVLVGF